jgi:alpha-beta hydrolase superfamily lysophospholipase
MIKSLLRICVLLAIALSMTVQVEAAKQSAEDAPVAAAKEYQGDVYILSGGFGVFSTGLGKLKAQLAQKGVSASLASYQSWRSISQKIVEHRQQYGRKPVVIIGHSLGANNAISIANALKKKGIQVDLIVSLASTAPMTVPSNVRNVFNVYFKTGGWGYIFTGESGFAGNLNNVDMSKQPGMTHFNVDDDPALRDQVVRNVLRYVRPAKAAEVAQP